MKKATFIAVVATAVVMLGGCGIKTPGQVQRNAEKFNSDTIIEQKDIILQQEKDLQAKDDEIADLKERIAELEASNQNETPEKSETSEATVTKETSTSVAVRKEEVKVPIIPKDQERIQVSAFYHGKDIPLYVATDANRSAAIDNAEYIYQGVMDRDLSIVVNGVSVSKVYLMDHGFHEVEDLSYDSVDNTYSAQYYMPGDGVYTFLIQTVHGSHYYTTVAY